MERLKDRQASIEQMRAWAVFDNRPQQMKAWVEDIFDKPDVAVDYNNARQQSIGSNGQIAYAPLRVMAGQWDRMGLTSPTEFVNAVECEVPGTDRYQIVQDALNDFAPPVEEVEQDDWWNF